MSSYATNNERSSATTSKTAPPNRPDDKPSKAGDYLVQQTDEARKAISRSATDLKNTLLSGVDPRGWTREHPWIAVGSATIAGFVAAMAVIPTKDQQALNRLKAIERALSMEPERRTSSNGEGEKDASDGYAQGKHSFLTGLGKEILGAIKPLLLSTLTAGITAATARPSAEEMQAHAQAANNKPPTPPEM